MKNENERPPLVVGEEMPPAKELTTTIELPDKSDEAKKREKK